MSRRTGVVLVPDRLESPGEQKPGRARQRVNLHDRSQRLRKPKRRLPSVGSESSGSLYRIDDAAAFKVALTEGDTFKSTGQFRRAIQSYSRALEKQPLHRGCLLARSQCYQQVGDNRRALADANKALEEDKKFIKGLLQKAECYYNMGEFEYALVNYHRGQKLRPEIQAFRLGVQKSQAAIENCVGESAGVLLTKEGDLSFFADEQKPDASKRREAELASAAEAERREKGAGARSPRRKAGLGAVGSKAQTTDTKTVKQLLGELYADKEYLEKLLQETDKSSKTKSKEAVIDITTTCLDYLDTRTDFWSQRQPRKSNASNDIDYWSGKQINAIHEAMAKRDYRKAVSGCILVLDRFVDRPIDIYGEKISLVHCLKGRAHLELDEREDALRHHTRDLEISTQSKSYDGITRARENLVLVYLKYQDFAGAIEFFKKTLEGTSSPIERAWLHHEIGKCHFEMKNFKKAADSGQNSLLAAREARDLLWQLNSSVLVAESNYESMEYDSALSIFNEAYVIAERLNDRAAQNAIREAIHKVKAAMKLYSDSTSSRSTEFKEEKEGKEQFGDKMGATDTYKFSFDADKKDDDERDERNNSKSKDQVDAEDTKSNSSVKSKSKQDISGTKAEKTKSKLDAAAQGDQPDDDDNSQAKTTGKSDQAIHISTTKAEGNVDTDNSTNSKVDENKTTEAESEDNSSPSLIKYQISISISDLEGAGTDEDIYVQLVGEAAVSRKEILDRSSIEDSSYERGKNYTGTLSVLDVGKILKVVISHNGTQPGAGCHISNVRVDVEEGRNPKSYHFECNKWFDRGQDDRLIERELVPTDSD